MELGQLLLIAAGDVPFASRILAAVIWAGVGILTVSFLVLMRSRWGQVNAISKCVAMSVFAHVLFFTYAYTTRLIFDSPNEPPETVIRVALAEDSGELKKSEGTRPWNDVTSDFQVAPELTSPQRPDTSVPDLLEATDPPPEEADIDPRPVPEPQSITKASREPVPSDLQPAVEPAEKLVQDDEQADVPTPANETPADPPDLLTKTMPQELTDAEAKPIGEAVAAQEDITKFASSQPLEAIPTTARPSASDQRQPVGAAPAEPAADRAIAADRPSVPKLYELRNSRDRLALVKQNGGNEQTEHAVEAALAWLARVQEADGRWDPSRFQAGQETRTLGHDRGGAGIKADTGITGLALLTFLAAGHTHYDGAYRRNVQRGLEYLLSEQASDGNLAGDAKFFARMYCHGMATLAASEALAMTRDSRLRPHVERAIQYTIHAQDATSGGWRYQPGDRDGDMSQFGWQVMALKSAEMAGIAIPSETRSGMLRFLRNTSRGQHRGLATYRPGAPASRTMTAEALACRYFLNVHQDYRSIKEAIDFVSIERPDSATGKPNFYYWYYATLSLRQSESAAWREWNRALQQALLSRQESVGPSAGSWSPETVWGSYGGRVYSTALATLCLEVYYRYLPVYQVDDGLRSADRNWSPARTLR